MRRAPHLRLALARIAVAWLAIALLSACRKQAAVQPGTEGVAGSSATAAAAAATSESSSAVPGGASESRGHTANASAPTAPAATSRPASSTMKPAPSAAAHAPAAAATPSASRLTRAANAPVAGASSSASSTSRTGAGTAPAAAASAPAPTPTAAGAAEPGFASILAGLPFRKGERLEYQVKFGFLSVGNAALEVLGLDQIRGTPAVHTVFSVSGGVKLYRVNDRYETWFDPRDFSTLRAIQDIDEGSYDKTRRYEVFPDRQVFTENAGPEQKSTAEPLDEGSFLFFIRSIPLEVGKTYTFDRYFRPDRNPVRVIVLRKEHVKVPAGQFNTIVVRPVIKAKGIFSEGGNAQLWFTDDSARTLVQLKTSLKFGSLNLYLKSMQAGTDWIAP